MRPDKKNTINVVRRWLAEWFDEAANAFPESLLFSQEASFFRLLVPHSIRRSGVKWAAECMGQEWQMVVQGRWSINSISFRLYIQEGASRREDYVSRMLQNPVYRLWVWQYGVVSTQRKDVQGGNAQRVMPRKRSRMPGTNH